MRAPELETARRAVEIEHVGMSSGDLEETIGATTEQEARRRRGRWAKRQLAHGDVLASELGKAVVEERSSQQRRVLEAVHPPGQGRELHAKRIELLAVPAGTNSSKDPLAAELRRQLDKRSQSQRGVCQSDVDDARAQNELVRHGAGQRELDEGIAAADRFASRPAMADEQVVGQKHAVQPGVLDRPDLLSESGRGRNAHCVDLDHDDLVLRGRRRLCALHADESRPSPHLDIITIVVTLRRPSALTVGARFRLRRVPRRRVRRACGR